MMTGTELQHRTAPPAPDSRFLPRVVGIVRLDRRVAMEIARSREAFSEASIIALLVAVAGMISAQADSLGAVLAQIVQAYGVWILSALLIATIMPVLVGTPTSAVPSRDAALRLIGYAQAPLLLGFAAVIPPFAGLANAAGWILMMATTAFAIRHLMRLSWSRALIAAFVARIVAGVPVGILTLLLGSGNGILGGIL